MYIGKGQYSNAILAMQQAYGADPENVTYHKELGAIYFEIGEFDQAMAFFRKVVQDNPKEAIAYLGLGQAYAGKRQFDAAIPEFQKAAQLDPEMRSAPHFLAQAQLQTGHFRDAQATYRGILAQYPDDKRAQAGLDFATRQAH
jgi:tetratricopeptide (TPR) repeat protein